MNFCTFTLLYDEPKKKPLKKQNRNKQKIEKENLIEGILIGLLSFCEQCNQPI